MDAPTPISLNFINQLENDNKIIKREYNIEINNEKHKLKLTIDNKLINLKIYKINNMDFKYYENQFNLKDINNILYKNSNICNNLEEVLELIDSIYKNKKLIINNNKDNIMNIIIKYPIGIKEYESIIKLNKKEIGINEKFKIILNEIMIIKKDNDKIINDKLNNIEQLLIELKDNVNKKLEENKNIINKLKNINENNKNNLEKNKEEINLLKNEIYLIKYPEIKEFYKKYNLNIEEININKLNLGWKGIGNEEIEDLKNIYFKELKQLYLYFNNISDINVLAKVDFKELQVLYLDYNKISDINILEKVCFKDLKVLYLYDNNITDIKVLEKVKFEKLEILFLSNNKISDINILEKVNFKELKELYLDDNNISDIKVLEKANFNKLEILNLNYNKISNNINIL